VQKGAQATRVPEEAHATLRYNQLSDATLKISYRKLDELEFQCFQSGIRLHFGAWAENHASTGGYTAFVFVDHLLNRSNARDSSREQQPGYDG